MFFNGYKMLFSLVLSSLWLFTLEYRSRWIFYMLSHHLLYSFVVTFACMTHLMHYGIYSWFSERNEHKFFVWYSIRQVFSIILRRDFRHSTQGFLWKGIRMALGFEQSQKVYFIRAGTRCKVAYHMVYHRYYCCRIRSSRFIRTKEICKGDLMEENKNSAISVRNVCIDYKSLKTGSIKQNSSN